MREGGEWVGDGLSPRRIEMATSGAGARSTVSVYEIASEAPCRLHVLPSKRPKHRDEQSPQNHTPPPNSDSSSSPESLIPPLPSMADADAAPPSPPPPAMRPPSNASLPPPSSPPADTSTSDATPAGAKSPNLPDTPASADPDTPFSDADASVVAPADAVASSDAAVDAPGDAEDDGINASGARKHMTLVPPAPLSRKSKKKNSNSVWTRPTSRKGKKKAKQPAHAPTGANGSRHPKPKPSCGEDELFLTPAPRLAAERNDDAPGLPVLLSRVFKSERIELSDDRLTAGSTKGFRMIRATRGVSTGAWYFEVKVLHLGPSGHTRIGWATNNADLQTPVGCDGFGFGYRDVDGSKVHKAWRAKYADEGYGEGDVLGFYISLPDGEQYEPKQPDLVHYKGLPFHIQVMKDEQKMPDPVPGSEICYLKNGVSQGTAFVDIPGGRYYPAASMYTLPDEPNCEVRFNFGPDFEFFPEDFGGRPAPQAMSEVPYQAYGLKNEAPTENGTAEKAG